MRKSYPQGRIAITGAGSGLGRGMALRFGSAGWRVAVSDLDPARAHETLSAIEATGGNGFATACDVRSESDLDSLAAAVADRWGGIDVLVNNAGVCSAGTVAATSLEDWRWMLDINLLGVVRGCRAFVPLMVEAHSGHIVNVASFAAIAQAPGVASYNVAKAGVVALSETLRGELADDGVGVSVLCPSFVPTNLIESFRGPDPRMRAAANRLIERGELSAADVAEQVWQAVHDDRFLILTHRETRGQYRLKRLAPNFFYRQVHKLSAALRPREEPPG